jgi:hypothetical protein
MEEWVQRRSGFSVPIGLQHECSGRLQVAGVAPVGMFGWNSGYRVQSWPACVQYKTASGHCSIINECTLVCIWMEEWVFGTLHECSGRLQVGKVWYLLTYNCAQQCKTASGQCSTSNECTGVYGWRSGYRGGVGTVYALACSMSAVEDCKWLAWCLMAYVYGWRSGYFVHLSGLQVLCDQ